MLYTCTVGKSIFQLTIKYTLLSLITSACLRIYLLKLNYLNKNKKIYFLILVSACRCCYCYFQLNFKSKWKIRIYDIFCNISNNYNNKNKKYPKQKENEKKTYRYNNGIFFYSCKIYHIYLNFKRMRFTRIKHFLSIYYIYLCIDWLALNEKLSCI